MRRRTQARELALKILYAVDISKDECRDVSRNFWDNNDFKKEVREYAQKLVDGTCQRSKEIDKLITKYTDNWRLDRMAVIDRNIIRMACFELLFVDEIPPKVAINEAVDLAKRFGDEESGRFVNGVLDKINKTECKKEKTLKQKS